ncbi:putative Disease resistance protein family [Melia azedarach]|uniref:Disease resistance protein family n=1 Tax=Melia azedarach TaxID=155640 RepID=A0ACC1Y4H5_MELAZ|nr:putative Disease resistance protein family [Melia azedarach]
MEYCSSLMDMTWLVFAPNLKKIDIWYCDNMEEIISVKKWGEVSEKMGNLNLFAEVEFLCLVGLSNLKSIYWNPLPFRKLKTVNVIGCPKLKKLPLDSNSAKEHTIVIKGQKNWWKRLEWEDQATENAFRNSYQKA